MYNNEFSQEFEQAIGQELEAGGYSMETFEFNPEYLGETSGATQGESFEMSGEYANEYSQEFSNEYGNEYSGELNETLEMELAHELLEVTNEQELNMFLGKLIKGAGKAIGNFAKSGVGRAIGGVLKTVAKKALPIAGGALGTFFGGPLGGMIGNKLGSAAGNLFELELEGLSPEDQEFETARAYVRFANSAASRAAALQSQRRGAPASAVVRQALAGAARQHAPGLLRPRNPNGTFRSLNGRPGQRQGARRPARPGFGGFRRPAVPGPGYASNDYSQVNNYGQAQPDGNGYDPSGYDGPEAGDMGEPGGGGATRGTWLRRGNTLVIQL
ncbi:hypothetical protein Q5H92_14250 [Hymenobacter sp. M29]|uniref:Glycine zipper domain-containing protein n=1 Tax=Hymenobacter mellowenesis TaxID=3063995 RepID=A0ABT9ACE5_9BACT|nr:hypothetical protein [Hymenobacter sp. M29]MDO7847527.1 hypothetical protein [Hymenobacter sp. M29]